MSVDYVIFSRRPASELARVVADCEDALEEWYARHDGLDAVGEFNLGGRIPTAGEALALIWDDAGPAPSDSPRVARVLAELAEVKSAITISRPGGWDTDPLQVSVFRFLAKQAGDSLVLLVDSLQPTADVLADLTVFTGDDDFPPTDTPPAPPPQPTPQRVSPVGVVVTLLERAIRSWEEQAKLELAANADRELLAEALFEHLCTRDATKAHLVDWLIEIDDVVEVYASDEELAADLAELTSP